MNLTFAKIQSHYKTQFLVCTFPLILVLPLPLIYSSISFGALAIWAFMGTIKSNFQKPKLGEILGQNFVLIFIVTFILDLILDGLYNQNFIIEFRETRLPLLLTPIILFYNRRLFSELLPTLLFSIVAGTLLYIVYADLYLIYFYNFIANVPFDFDHFLKYNFSGIPGAYHHTYQGIYFGFSILILLHYANSFNLKWKAITLTLAGIIFFHMFFMAGKGVMAIIFFLILSRIPSFVSNSRTKLLLYSSITLILLIIGYYLLNNQVYDSLQFSYSNRLESWRCSWSVFRESPWIGSRPSIIQQNLDLCISDMAVSSHNQFIEEYLNYGIFGIWFLIFWIFAFRKAKSNKLFQALLFLLFTVSFYENILSLQRGVLFTMFFVSLFYFCGNLPLKQSTNE